MQGSFWFGKPKNQRYFFEPFGAHRLPMVNEVKKNRQDAFETVILNRGIIFEERK